MDYEQLLGNSRWEAIKAISKGKASATELAQVTKASLPNVSQQLKLLEAYDLVEYLKDQRQGPGKPRQIYQLKKDLCHLTFARRGFADKRFFTPSAYHGAIISTLFVPNMQDHAYLHRLFLDNEELLTHCSIAYLKSGEHEIEILLVTDQLALIREKYSSTIVEHGGKMRKIIAWTHSLHEITEGIGRKDAHFETLCKSPLVIHDPKNSFEKIRKK